jgi:hypothetical protein
VKLLTLACVVAACSGGHVEAPRETEDTALLRDLPGGNAALFGGDYYNVQGWLDSILPIIARGSRSEGDEHVRAWMTCASQLAGKRVLGGLVVVGDHVELRVVSASLHLSELVGCANRAHLTATLDSDGKYLSISLSDKATLSFLELRDGAVYTRRIIAPAPQQLASSRGELESDVASAARTSAAEDTKLRALAARADHGKSLWFAGTGASTPLERFLGESSGSIEVAPDGGVAVDVTAQIIDPATADRIASQYLSAKQYALRQDAKMQQIAAAVDLQRDTDRIHLTVHWSGSQVSELIAELTPKPSTLAEVIDKMNDFADRMCRCADEACASKVDDEMTAWMAEQSRSLPKNSQATDADKQRINDITVRMTRCMTRAVSTGTTP